MPEEAKDDFDFQEYSQAHQEYTDLLQKDSSDPSIARQFKAAEARYQRLARDFEQNARKKSIAFSKTANPLSAISKRMSLKSTGDKRSSKRVSQKRVSAPKSAEDKFAAELQAKVKGSRDSKQRAELASRISAARRKKSVAGGSSTFKPTLKPVSENLPKVKTLTFEQRTLKALKAPTNGWRSYAFDGSEEKQQLAITKKMARALIKDPLLNPSLYRYMADNQIFEEVSNGSVKTPANWKADLKKLKEAAKAQQ